MFARHSPALAVSGGSVVLLAGLIGALYWISRPEQTEETAPPLVIYCAEAMRLPMEAIKVDYEKEFSQKVQLHFGASQTILTNLELSKKGDLFIPADDSYIRMAKEKGLLGEVKDLATMRGVLIVRAGFDKEIKTWDDFIAKGHKIGLANAEATAVGKLTKEQLSKHGLWDGVIKRKPTFLGTVNDVGNRVTGDGSIDVGIVWDAVAAPLLKKKPGTRIVKLPELDRIQARVQIAVAKSTKQRELAERFVDFVRLKGKGAAHLKDHGFSNVDEDEEMGSSRRLVVFCAAALREPMETIVADYENAFGQKVLVRYGPSQTLLADFEKAKKADLFIPADESYVRLAKKKNLVTDVKTLASMQGVVLVRAGFPREIKSWSDFVAEGNKIALANPDTSAIGKIAKYQLLGIGMWAGLEERKPKIVADVNEAAASLKTDGNDVALVWEPVALAYQARNADAKIVTLKELEQVTARVQIAIAKSTEQRDHALRFMSFVRAKDKGAVHLKKAGYAHIDEGEAMDDRRELVIYAGAMLRPGLEAALKEFEKREKVRIVRVYNGCGILVTQMKAGNMPDLYFACDTSFMTMVKDEFEPAANVTNNQLMITVKKGNPKEVFKLVDLAKPGLRVGVGHEHQCALGSLTKETFIRTGVYAKVIKNVVVQAPSGDLLINQLRTGALDVVIAYRSNVLPYEKELEGIEIKGIPCATPSQPIAVSRSAAHPELSRRLMEFIQNEESRHRFENAGFGWESKDAAPKEK